MSLPRTRYTALAVAAVCAMSASACVKQNAPGVGLVKFDSSAVFGVPTKPAAPSVPDFVPPIDTSFDTGFVPSTVNPIADLGPCPPAKLTAFPKASATVKVLGTPPEGAYRWKRDLFQFQDLTQAPPKFLNQPFGLETRAIRRVATQSDHQFTFEMLKPDPFAPSQTIITTFEVNSNPKLVVNQTVAGRTIGVVPVGTQDVRVADPSDAPGIFITRIEEQDSNGARVGNAFAPQQPMLILPLEGGIVREGETFKSVAISTTDQSVISNDGLVGRTSRIDACGEIVEGFAVTLKQTLTSDVHNEGDATNAASRDETREISYVFATQYGALPIQEELTIGDNQRDPIAVIGKWELGGLTPTPLPDSLK